VLIWKPSFPDQLFQRSAASFQKKIFHQSNSAFHSMHIAVYLPKKIQLDPGNILCQVFKKTG